MLSGNKFLSCWSQFETTSEVGLRLLEQREVKLDVLRIALATAEAALGRGEGVGGEAFMQKLMK